MVSREAVMLISIATEEFVRRLSEASHRLAVRENRATVQRKDVGT
jgi:DNA polymerase epsilon subunit 4